MYTSDCVKRSHSIKVRGSLCLWLAGEKITLFVYMHASNYPAIPTFVRSVKEI